MMICSFTSLFEFTTFARDEPKCEIAPLFGRTPHTVEVCEAIINEVHKVNSTGATRPVCAQFAGGKVDGLSGGVEDSKWPLSGGTPEECRPLSLYCDGECRAAASGRRPSTSSQSWVGFRTLSCCWGRGVQVAWNPGGMLRASGWDPPPRHFTCWAGAVSVPLSTLECMHKSCFPAQIEYVWMACQAKMMQKWNYRYKIWTV